MSHSIYDDAPEREPEPDPWVPQSAESHALACATINGVCRELAKRKEDYMGSILDHFASATRPCGLTEHDLKERQ